MNQKGTINKDYIKSYSASYTNNILDTAFKESPYLQGGDLKLLCSPEQINYNLLKAIFLQWEAEVNKLKNPYFNHDAPAVQNALKSYMEVLSRHIRLDKGSLRPLLQQAVEETLYQVYSPLYFFENFLWPSEISSLGLTEINKLRKFVRINQSFIKELTTKWEEENRPEITKKQYLNELQQLGISWVPNWELTEDYQTAFSKVVSLRPQAIWRIEDEAGATLENDSQKNINQEFSREVVSLNDTLQKEQKTLADELNKQVAHIDNIKKSLNINQKFRFVNELYGGDTNEFNKVLDKVDGCNNYQEAMLALNNNSSHSSDWNMQDKVVKELIDLVSKRFSESGPAFDEHPSSAK